MTIPQYVQVGPIRYKVDCTDAAVFKIRAEHQNRALLGEADHTQQVITVCPQQGGDQIRDTLLHETLHAVWFVSGIGTSTELSEELVVSMMCSLLLDTIRRNPELMGYLVQEGGETG